MKLEETHPYNPFSSDPLNHAEVARLIGKWSVEAAMETGTYHGHTTLALSFLCEFVVTAELDPLKAATAETLFQSAGRHNIRLIRKSSLDAIAEVRDELKNHRSLYYLDAHWNDYWPLLDELKAIASITGPKPVIVIHDFQVPGHPDLSFDTYKGVSLNLDYVSLALDEIYQGRNSIHYNALAFGSRRGVLYVEPENY